MKKYATLLAALTLALLPLSATAKEKKPKPIPVPLFTNISKESGLDFIHFNGMSREFYFPEMTGQGGGFIDYDNDGDLDVYLVQGNMLGPGKTMKDALFPPRNKKPRDRLFRNDLKVDKKGKKTLTFTDVTDKSGIEGTGYGMGVISADFNNDGWPDLYVTNYGPNKMLYNKGDGSFRDATKESGTDDKLWGTSAAAFDYDGDGRLDLYVANYVYFDLKANKRCFAKNSRRDYCGPSGFRPQKDRLFHNIGGGKFEDVTHKVLAAYKPGPGLGVITFDANGDGQPDIYVANDGKANQLWINRKGKLFIEDALFSGAALNQDGQAEASMGVTAGDFDADGDEDLFMTHLMGETNTLYVNNGKGLFEDRTIALGLSAASFPFTGFGANWIDYDNDGLLDLFIVNGAVLTIESQAAKGDPYPLRQPNQLFHNEKGRRFKDVSSMAGDAFKVSKVSRGAAFGDVDNDGDTDVLVFNNNGPARLLRNDSGNGKRWLGLKLTDPKNGSDLIGARAILKRKGKPPLLRQVRTDGSYCSSNDPRIIFGLGASDSVDSVDITWPDGTKETWKGPVPMKYTTLTKGLIDKKEKK